MFDAAGPVLGIDPGVSRCGYGAVLRGAGGSLGAACFGAGGVESGLALRAGPLPVIFDRFLLHAHTPPNAKGRVNSLNCKPLAARRG